MKPHTIIFRNASMGKKTVFKTNHYWDKIPEHYTMIYKCRLRHWIRGIQTVPLLIGGLWFYYVVNFNKVNSILPIREHIIVISFLCFLTALTLYFNFAASRYVMGIYHHEGQFVAVRRSIFGRLKQLSYNLNDVTCNLKKGVDYHANCDISINNTKCHIVAADFISPVYYNMHLGDGSHLYPNASARALNE